MDRNQAVLTLNSGISKLSGGDQEFARSMLRQLGAKGRLSEKQWWWVEKFANDTVNPPKMATHEVGSFAGLKRLFDHAKQHLKRPAITVEVPGVGEVKLNVAGPKAKKPGSINVVGTVKKDYPQLGAFGQLDSVWFGRIDGEVFEASFKQAPPAALVEFLKKMSADPAKAAHEHGTLTGRCCFCNKALEDEKSTAKGYGPVCAKNYSLPWGK